MGDGIISQQRFAQPGLSFRDRHRFIAFRAQQVNDCVHQLRIVGRIDRHRVAHFKAQAPAGEIDLEMARVLFGFGPAHATIDHHFAGKRIGSAYNGDGGGRVSVER